MTKCKYYRRCRELEITNADYCPKVPEDCDIYSLMEVDGTLGFKVARLDAEHRDTPDFWMNVLYEHRGQRREGREGFR